MSYLPLLFWKPPKDYLYASGIFQILKDDFTDNHVTGTLNNTDIVPGPGGKRFVVDTGSRFSTSGGLLRGATGGAAGDPALWDGDTRLVIPGLTIVAEITPANNSSIADIGWDTNQASSMFHGIRFGTGVGTMGVIEAGAQGSNIGAYSASTSYKVAIVLKGPGSGFFIFIKGGAFTNWTKLYTSVVTNLVNTLFPTIQFRAAHTSSFLYVFTGLDVNYIDSQIFLLDKYLP